MKHFTYIILITLSLGAIAASQRESPRENTPHSGGAAIVYAEGGAFLIEGPKGWITDRQTGQELGVCCVWYPKDSTWDDAQTVMYPNITSKGPGQQTLNEFMESDLADFREHNPELTYEVGEDIPLKNTRIAKLRFFYNVNHGSSEAVAYIDEKKIIAFLVMSSKTKKDLNEAIPLFRSVLQSYEFMDAHIATGAPQKKDDSQLLPKD